MIHPNNLTEAVQYLYDKVGPEQRLLVKDLTERQFLIAVNGMLGVSIKNSWGLWYNETPLAKWFTSVGITNGDDRSSIVLSALFAQLQSRPFDLKGRILVCQTHWLANGVKDGIPQIHERGSHGY